MKEYYNSDEYKTYDEFKDLKAEQYYKPENMVVRNEYYNKQNELSTDDVKTPPKTINNDSKSKKEEQKENFDEIKNQHHEELANANASSSSSFSSSTAATTSSSAASTASTAGNAVAKVIEAASTMAGSVAVTVAGAAGIVAMAANVLASTAKMDVLNLDVGADYASFTVDVSELDPEVNYFISISNPYTNYKLDVNEAGRFSDLVKGLKSYSSYEIALYADSDIGPVRYDYVSFSTLKADSPTAVTTYEYGVNQETNNILFSYSTYISDLNDNGSDYHLEIVLDDDVIHTNDVVVDSYMSGSLEVRNNVKLEVNVYALVYDQIEMVGHNTFEIGVVGDWSEPKYTWSDDLSKVKASRKNLTFNDVYEQEEVSTTSRIIKPATCEEDGLIEYSATFENNIFKPQKTEKVIPKLGHDYKFDSFIWTDDGSSAQAKYICANDDTHIMLYDASITSEVLTPATYDDKGVTRYTATYEGNTDTLDVTDIPELKLAYVFDSFVWADDGSSAQAKYIHPDIDDPKYFDAEVTSEVIQAPTYEDKGITRYTATYLENSDTLELANIDELKLGYAFDSFVWEDDGSAAQAKYINPDVDNPKYYDATITSEILTPAKYDEKGVTRYTATFGEYTDTLDVTDIPELKLAYVFDSFIWEDDGSAAQAKYIHPDIDDPKYFDADITSEILTPATYDDKGVTRYTATYLDNSDTLDVTDIPELKLAYVFDSFIWEDDGSSAQAKYIHPDIDDPKYFDADITSEILTPATYDEKGVTRYTATYLDNSDTLDVTDIPELKLAYVFDSFIWEDDGSAAQAKYIHPDVDDPKYFDADITSEVLTPATYEDKGVTRYTATYLDNSDTLDVADIPELKLAYVFDSFIWEDDGSAAQAKYIHPDIDDPKYFDADITSEVIKDPTCLEKGTTRYTATYLEESDTLELDDVAALGHDYDEPVYTWATDNSKVTATIECKRDTTHSVTEEVNTTYTVITPATSTTAGLGRYKAEFESELFTTQEKDEEIPIDYDLTVFSIDDFSVDTIGSSGLSFTIKLNEYNSDITFKAKVLNALNEEEASGEFESDTLTLTGIPNKLSELKVEIRITYLEKEEVIEKTVKELLGIEVTFGDLAYDTDLKKYAVAVTYSSSKTITGYTAKLNVASTEVTPTTSGNKIIIDGISAKTFSIKLTLQIEDTSGATCEYVVVSDDFEYEYSLELLETTYDTENHLLLLKPKILAPSGYDLFIEINATTEVSRVTSDLILYKIPDDYVVFDISSISSGSVDYYLKKDADIICRNTLTLDLTLSLSFTGSSLSPNPSDCAITFDEATKTQILYMPTEVSITNPNQFVRVLVYDDSEDIKEYKDLTSGNAVFTNLPFEAQLSLCYYRYETVDGINYLIDSTETSGSTYITNAYVYKSGSDVSIAYVFSEPTNVRIYYDDDTYEDVTGTYNSSSYEATYACDSTKTPVKVSYTYTRGSEYDYCYQSDSWYTTHGFTKVGSDTYENELQIA